MDLDELDARRFRRLIPQRPVDAVEHLTERFVPHLPLPKHLDILYRQTSALVTALIVMKRRHQVAVFPKIRETVEQQTNHSYGEYQLCQSLTILPEGAVVPEWREDKRKRLPNTLHLSLVTQERIDQIDNFVKNYLTNYVKSYHSKFLKSIGEDVKDVQVWHVKFDLESVPPIQPVELKRPEVERQLKIVDSLEPVKPSTSTITVFPPDEGDRAAVPKVCRGLTSYFSVVKAVQEKAYVKEQFEEVVNNRHTTELLKMADLLNTIFCSRQKNSLPMVDILASVVKSDYFRSIDPKRHVEMIEKVVSLSDGYWKRIELRGLVYIQMQPDSVRTYQMVKGPIAKAIMDSRMAEKTPVTSPRVLVDS